MTMKRVASRCCTSALVALLVVGAACGSDQHPRSSSPSGKGGEGGNLQDLPAGQAAATGAPAAGAAPRDSTLEPSAATLPFLPERPAPRLVTDFEREAVAASPRAADARGLGGACQSTAECRPGLGCADVVFSGVGETHIAGGYCSRWCEQDADCAALVPDSFCAVKYFGSDLNLCLASCLTGDTQGAEKCGGRQDLSCGRSPPAGYERTCLPNCRDNSDCATGTCSASHGLCDARLSALAAPLGALCQANNSSYCNGFCATSAPGATLGVCSGFCRLGSTCGEGAGSVCAATEFGQREGDGGICEQSCSSSLDCRAGYTACAPTGFLLPSGERQAGCSQVYAAPVNLTSQTLSVEQLQAATLGSSVLKVSTNSIFEALSQRLDVQNGAVCVTGDVVGTFGALLYLEFQLRPNNGPPLDASTFSAFTLDVQGPHVVRLDAYAHGTMFRYLTPARDAGDLGEGPQRIGFDELFDIFHGDTPFSSSDAAQLEAVQFSLIMDDGPGPFRLCIGNFALQGPAAPDAGGGG